MRILTFTDIGIGNLVFYLPVLRALSEHDLTIVCPNEELRQLIDFNIDANFKIEGKYDVSVNNFLSQRRRELTKILRIPRRIGHDCKSKGNWLFNEKVEFNIDRSEEYYNNLLLEPLGLKPIYEKIKFPDFNVPEHDIIISPHSSEPCKDWQYYAELIKRLGGKIKVLRQGEYPLIVVCALISNCKLFIGNDSGLAKISANLGIPTIQIFRWFTNCFVRSRINGINLIEPSIEDVLCEI